MNKAEFVDQIAQNAGLTKKDAEKFLGAFVDVTGQVMKKGDKISLVGFGTFEARERAARTGRNPKTGETIKIAASKTPAFKAGKGLKDMLNSK